MEYACSAEFQWVAGFGDRIEELRGEGQVRLPDGPVATCAFSCVQLADGRILIECHLLGGAVLELFAVLINESPRADWRLQGLTVDGLDVRVKEALSNRLELRTGGQMPSKVLFICNEVNVFSPETARIAPAHLTYGLANLEFVGDEATEVEIEGKRRWAMDTFRFQIASAKIRVRQVMNYRQVVRQMKDRRSLAITAEANLELAGDVVELRTYDELMDAICILLSLANGSKVSWLYSKVTDQDRKLASMRMLSKVSLFWLPGGPLIGGTTAKEVKQFVAHSYGAYMDEKEKYNLPVAIGYYLASKCAMEWNTRFLLACIALETLVGNFAQHASQGDIRYIVPKGDFEERQRSAALKSLLKEALLKTFPQLGDDDLDDALVKLPELNRRSFRRCVKRMLAELDIEHDDLRFIELRSQVVHTGTVGSGFRETWGHYTNLIDLLDQIFLRILRYEGEHLQYSKQVRAIAQ